MQQMDSLPTIVAPNGAFKLRPFAATDILSLVKHINSSHIADRVSNVPYPYTNMDAELWILRLQIERLENHFANRIDFAIDVDGELVGSVAFIEVHGEEAQVSYWLSELHQGHGIMTEAVKELVRFGLNECGFLRIWGYTWSDNIASRKVLKRAGFKLEGILRKKWPKNGKRFDSHLFAIVV